MAPRIDTAEVVSFRLEVPSGALERLPEEVGALPLTVETFAEGRIRVTAGDCRLTFLVVGAVARLWEVALASDERGLFFQRVLGPLVVHHKGDLHVKLVWNVADRNSHGAFAEVRIVNGVTTYPGLSNLGNLLAAAPEPKPEPLTVPKPGDGARAPDEGPRGPLTPEEQEIERLLEEGRRHYEEYLRLKNRSQAQTT